MAQSITDLTQGMPVEIGKIDRELKRLWQEGEGAATRASLINFAVFCESAGKMNEMTDVIAQITKDHACRAILIGMDETIEHAPVQACIMAHCHLGKAGQKQVCCEQITFLLGKDGLPLIPNIVFSHLDSDLPLVLWWRGEFPAESEEQLWTWVDRLIYDSLTWTHVPGQVELLRTSIEPASPRITLCDLNWTRSLYVRQAVAQIFDHPEYLEELPALSAVEITHAPGMRSTAMLLAGWLAAQLQWQPHSSIGAEAIFTNRGGKSVIVTLKEAPGQAIGGIRLQAGTATINVAHHEGSGFLHADIVLPDGRESHYLMPGGNDGIVCLLNDELMSGGKHKVYLKAMAAVVPLL